MPEIDFQVLRTLHPPELYVPQMAAMIDAEGYQASTDDVRSRIENLSGDDRLILAVAGEKLLGFAHIHISRDLIVSETADVIAILVSSDHRRHGIGRQLINAAEIWARQTGRSRLLLHTDVVRTSAHAFFTALGYTKSATILEFIRDLR